MWFLLDLKKGKNQLLVKFFSNFNRDFSLAIDTGIEQKLYRLPLGELRLKKNDDLTISWKTHQPFTPHENLNMPNLSLRITKL